MQYCRYIQKTWAPFEEYIIRMQPWNTIQSSIIKSVKENVDDLRSYIAAANRNNFKIFKNGRRTK